MSRIALTVVAPDMDAEVDPKFGRATAILIVDSESQTFHGVPNPGRNAPGGAGVRVAQFLSKKNVDVVVSGDFGPKARDALETARIAMLQVGRGVTARQALERFAVGELTASSQT
jgi:predicted Fe-Mo cluster-binding NifX family protein